MTLPGRSQGGLELASEFLIGEVRRAWPWHWKQGKRRPPLGSANELPAVGLLLDFRIKGVSDDAARGIAAWSRGLEVEVFDRVPEPLQVLQLQASGARCVSLLPDGVATLPHSSALYFLLHDLCHLGKFADSRYYREQVGFFAAFARAVDGAGWRLLEAELDTEWIAARNQVLCDMNGSSIFLFAAFKMKLKMAVRRNVARAHGREPALYGALDFDEERAYRELLGRALTLLGLSSKDLRTAAIATSARRDCPHAAALISEYFRGIGTDVLDRGSPIMLLGGASAAGR